MTDSVSMPAYMASHVINLFPSLIRSELLSDTKLLEELGLATQIDATLCFGDTDIAFSRTALFNTIRSAFENTDEEFSLEDSNNKLWSLRSIPAEVPTIALTKGGVQILNESFWPLCPDVDRRLVLFETEAKERGLSSEELEHWRTILLAPKLNDNDVSDLLFDLDCSPSHIDTVLTKEFQGRVNKVSTLVPDDIRYYERLVGKHCGSKNVDEYCKNELNQYFRDRVQNGVTENDFLMCMHKSISKFISDAVVDETAYQSRATRAIETCHPILLLTCIEIGITRFKDSSASTIKKLFECISSEKTSENISSFCSMAVFVDGELSRLQLFRGMPPFYRRLASFTQAGLIIRAGIEEGVAFDKLEEWAFQQRGLYFFCQGFVDLIAEPRWMPTYLTAEQFRNELYGRVYDACQTADKCEVTEYLKNELMLGSRLNLHSFLPGPLEGNSTPAVVPDEISKMLAKHISGDASLESFRVLINSAPFWGVDDKYLDRTVSLLESAQHKLAALNDKDSVYQVVNGLAQVSCMTRSKKLAESVMILSRLYRDYIDVDSEPQNYLAVGVVAGAAFRDKDGWAEFIGQWCTELAYLSISEESVSRVREMLERLCVIEPYLYHTCSKALDIFKMIGKK